eukprot:SM003799S14402  [mRNA]  locus=s3799:148:1120:+ [translate_table: standard]
MSRPTAKMSRPHELLAALGVRTHDPSFSLVSPSSLELDFPTTLPAPACERLECPPYSLVHTESDFEVRRYRAATWVITGPLPDVSFARATLRGFHRLFRYIQGANVNSSRVEMTAPVATAVMPSAGPFCSSAFAVGLYVPAKWGRHPPVPLDELELK